MLTIYLICITLGFSNAIPDFLNNHTNISLCKPCTAFWLGLIIGLIAFPFGSIEILVIPTTTYFINKLYENQLL